MAIAWYDPCHHHWHRNTQPLRQETAVVIFTHTLRRFFHLKQAAIIEKRACGDLQAE